VVLTIERVALLRRAELFAGTADRVLAGIARVLEEVTFPAGAVIMEAGAVEDWLFVVEHGEVEVIRPDRRVHMGVGSVVGELAVLDARPRSATVVALSPVRLLRLRKAVFDDALDAQPEIARGVIADLARRLRETHQPVS
jgi:CRP-like cAMP-binding protein